MLVVFGFFFFGVGCFNALANADEDLVDETIAPNPILRLQDLATGSGRLLFLVFVI